MVQLKCANSKCNKITELPGDRLPKKFICPFCHVLNTPQPETAWTGDEACGCLLPEGFEWQLPDGIISSPLGDLYISPDDGAQLTRLEWIEAFGFDPKPVWEDMLKLGKEGKPGYVNLSTLRRGKR